jgi:STE24 endopeptidase
LWAWAFVTAFCLVFNVLHPIWIAPLFNSFTPLPDGPVRAGIENLVRESGLRCDRLFEVDGSRQSSHSNACARTALTATPSPSSVVARGVRV